MIQSEHFTWSYRSCIALFLDVLIGSYFPFTIKTLIHTISLLAVLKLVRCEGKSGIEEF